MPARARQPNEASQQLIPLLLLGMGLVYTNNSATYLDREAASLGVAANPLAQILSGGGSTGQPPLYEIILHFWLRAMGGNFDYFRVLSVCFFLAGLFLVGRAGRLLAGPTAGVAVIWLGVLWPLGFHYGRLVASDSFSFFLVAGVTLSYLHSLENRTLKNWAVFLAFCVALVWTSYFGWAVLTCLAADQLVRFRAKEPSAPPKALLATVAVVCLAFAPLFSPFRSSVLEAINFHQKALSIFANAGIRVYSLLVSESVAPWDWRLSVPAALAVLVCLILVAWWAPERPRRFLCYSAVLIGLLAVAGFLQMRDLFMLSPWILLTAGIAVDATKPRWANFTLAAAFLAIGVIGWYGVYSRRYYSELQFVEPWQEVAGDAAAKIGSGATVISDRPSFLLYLTYFLRVPKQAGPWLFEGLLPDAVRHPQVFSPEGWLAAGHPTNGKMLLVRAGGDAGGSQPVDSAARQLDQSCGSISSRLRVRDEGYKWKQRFFPQLRDPQWRIEIREYDCDQSNSKQIYRIPPP
jgi:hypothetical protein